MNRLGSNAGTNAQSTGAIVKRPFLKSGSGTACLGNKMRTQAHQNSQKSDGNKQNVTPKNERNNGLKAGTISHGHGNT